MPSTDPSCSAEPARDTAMEIGRALRESRLARGEDLAEAAGRLRIRPDYLGALEEGEPERLPGRVYALGYLRSYGAYLGLHGDALAARLRASAAGPPPAPLNYRAPPPHPGRRTRLVVLALLLLGAGLWAGYRATPEGERDGAGQALPAPASELASSSASSVPRPLYAPPATPSEALRDRPATIPTPAPVEPPAAPGTPGKGGAGAGPDAPLLVLSASEDPPVPTGAPPDPRGGPTTASPAAGPPAPAQELPPVAVPGEPPAPSPEPVQTAPRYAVQVALVRDAADGLGEWRRLTRRHPDLARLEPGAPVPVELVGRGTFYRVLGGAFATRAEARAVCDRLRAEGGDCIVAVVAP